MSQSSLRFDAAEFKRSLLLWALSIPIGFFPILVDQLPQEISQTGLDWNKMLHDMVCDLDYLLAYLCVLYALHIQGEYTDCVHPAVNKCKRVCRMITVPLAVVWFSCSLRTDIEKSVYTEISFVFNICMTIITLVLGVCMNIFMAWRRDAEG